MKTVSEKWIACICSGRKLHCKGLVMLCRRLRVTGFSTPEPKVASWTLQISFKLPTHKSREKKTQE